CEYMLEATDKIAETTRHLVTSPDGYIPISYKCEIETIRGGIVRLSQLADSILSSDVDTVKINGDAGLEKDFIEHSIAIHSKGMTHEDFDEGAPSYSYLMLLYYLHSFISSFLQAIKNPEISGVTRQSIKMQKTSEIQTISEVFRYPQPAFLRRILKWRGVPDYTGW
ncbi:hypothetical protein, partial [Duncaniella muris]|uniref:hypothetical protein n=1 Tax=Duncaniella muris TaxID=2094150 RepID=UPI0025AFA3CE